MNLRTIIRPVVYLVSFAMFGIFIINMWVIGSTYSNVYYDIGKIPVAKVGLVLGTSNKLISGDTNQYFYQRIKVAAELFKSNKIEQILVSGDHRTKYYNEPQMMKEALIKEGIPEERIHTDNAGLRTLDSIIRCKLIFGQNNFIIITQPFHSYRALFIAKKHDIDAVAMVSTELDLGGGVKSKFREIFARTVAVWDLLVINKMPEKMGEQEIIN